MADKLSWSILVSRENLLARLLRMFYVVPPAVTSGVAAHQRNLMLRFNLPLSRAQRYGERVRDSRDDGDNYNESVSELLSLAEGSEQCDESGSAEGDDTASGSAEDDDAESDPARLEKLGTGPGEPPFPPAGGNALIPAKGLAEPGEIKLELKTNKLLAFPRTSPAQNQCKQRWDGSIVDLFASNYSCCCECCRRAPREWLLPRAKATYLLQQCSTKPSAPLLRIASAGTSKRLRVIRDRADCELGALTCGYVLKGSGSVKGHQKKRRA